MLSKKKSKKNIDAIFTERMVPSDKQVKAFEKAVKKKARQEEISTNLSAMYEDTLSEGDINKIKPKKNSFFVLLIKNIFVAAVLFSLAFFIYSYVVMKPDKPLDVELSIVAPEVIQAGKEFDYIINYENKSRSVLRFVYLEILYPDNFVASDDKLKNNYDLGELSPGEKKSLVISGQLIGKESSNNFISADLSYQPGDFSSQYKKSSVSSTIINNLGFDLDFEYSNAAFVGEDVEIGIIFKNVKENLLKDFEVSFLFPENINILNDETKASSSNETRSKQKILIPEKDSKLLWQVSGLGDDLETSDYYLPLRYVINKKISDNQELVIRLSKVSENEKTYIFAEKNINLNIMNSDINLSLTVNDSQNNSNVNFGEILNFSLNYVNKGDSIINDLTLMAVVKSDFVDWKSLEMSDKGIVGNNAIVWTKDLIPALAEINPGDEGVINFSLAVKDFSQDDLGKSASIQSYAQFSVGDNPNNPGDNKSNNIETKINSDLSFTEKVLYFDDNNIPVGSGPLPPRVGERSSFRVYWDLENNLHELHELKASMQLPSNVFYDNNSQASVGNISFNGDTRILTWNIDILPTSVYNAQASFNIGIIPDISDRDRILVLSPGSNISALDKETGSVIVKTTQAKTTKLEDDDIAGLSNSGIIE